MSNEPTLIESIKVAKDVSAFDDLYRRATASVGGYYAGIYVVTTRESGTFYFLPFEETKSKSFKGLQVDHYPDKRRPGKATIKFTPRSYIIDAFGVTKVQPSAVPADVLERFVEGSSKI